MIYDVRSVDATTDFQIRILNDRLNEKETIAAAIDLRITNVRKKLRVIAEAVKEIFVAPMTNEMVGEITIEINIERGELDFIKMKKRNAEFFPHFPINFHRSPERRRPRSSSRSPAPQKNRRFRRGSDEDTGNHEWGKKDSNDKSDQKAEPIEKEKPNFGLSGKLTEDTNKVNGVVINYAEPSEARKPKRRWRLYPFKGEQSLQTFYIHRQSCFLIGRDRKICDIPIDHPSCSKQHAVLQYRLVPYEKEDGSTSKRVRPYLLDMSSANGTFVNNKKIDSKKYVELLEKDVIKFGYSSREYVLLHENSKDEDLDDDVGNDDLYIKTEGD